MNPATAFGGYSNAGLVTSRGTTVNVPPGSGFGGNGTLHDPVACQGTITGIGGPINFSGGLTISGTGVVDLPSELLALDNLTSGMSGGLLYVQSLFVGSSGTGSFTQSGGSLAGTANTVLWVGYQGHGSYNVSGSAYCAGQHLAGRIQRKQRDFFRFSGSGMVSTVGYEFVGNSRHGPIHAKRWNERRGHRAWK